MVDPSSASKDNHRDVALQRALWRLFQSSDTPTALCSEALAIVTANKAFGIRVGAKSETALSGCYLYDVISVPPSLIDLPATGGQVAVKLPGGWPALASVASVDDLLLITLDAGLEGARLAEASRLLEEQKKVLEIGRLLSVLMTEDDLVGVVAEGLRELFRDRKFAIRVVEPCTAALTSLYSEGTLRAEERGVLTLKRSAVTKTRLPKEALQSDKVVVEDHYHLIFEETETGIGVPLTSGEELLGMINIEGANEQFLDSDSDERLVISLANHLSVALRNARLLRESRYLRGYLEKLIDNANALILVVDAQGVVCVFNRAFEELSGFGREEVVGRRFRDFCSPEDQAHLEKIIDLALHGKSATNVEVTVIARDGRRVKVAFNTASILDSNGRIESVIAIGNDLTRIWELKRQVIQAEKLATLGQLSAAVVHELNNPLTSITVYAEYLRDRLGELGAERDIDKAARILESTDRILRFTRNLVAYARPSDERPSRIDLRRVIEHSTKLCEHLIKTRDICLDITWTEGMPLVLGNQGKLQQVFINLITNACHAVEGGGFIFVSGNITNDQLEVRVRDNGHGMEAEVARRIFEPFFSTKAPGKGTGLGLSIVQEIVRSHGGEIKVESEPRVGTTFVLSFPALAAEP